MAAYLSGFVDLNANRDSGDDDDGASVVVIVIKEPHKHGEYLEAVKWVEHLEMREH